MKGNVIYVEDEPDDAFFMERAFQQAMPEVSLRIFRNGQEAWQFFTSGAEELAGESPRLILLDLNLPGRSGLEVLRQIRQDERLRATPVIIYTSSNQTVDVAEAYRRGCTAYLVKPGDPVRMRHLVHLLADFWIKENYYPPAN